MKDRRGADTATQPNQDKREPGAHDQTTKHKQSEANFGIPPTVLIKSAASPLAIRLGRCDILALGVQHGHPEADGQDTSQRKTPPAPIFSILGTWRMPVNCTDMNTNQACHGNRAHDLEKR